MSARSKNFRDVPNDEDQKNQEKMGELAKAAGEDPDLHRSRLRRPEIVALNLAKFRKAQKWSWRRQRSRLKRSRSTESKSQGQLSLNTLVDS